MIDRYSVKEISEIWSDKNTYDLWMLLERCHMQVMDSSVIFPDVDVDINSIREIEKKTKHDVVAFLIWLNSQSKSSRFKQLLHYGLTSSDIVDTAFVLKIRQSCVHTNACLSSLISSFNAFIMKLNNVVGVGRTHGKFAESYSYQCKFNMFLSRLYSLHSDINTELKTNLSFGKLSGALGDHKYISKSQENKMLNELFYFKKQSDSEHIFLLKPVLNPTQVIPRYYFSPIIYKLSLIGAVIEGFATQIRLLSRSECGEFSENFSKGQFGSSAMPHKRNPIFSENLCGLSRILRSYVSVTLENVTLWDERDISHSSTERVIFPDAFNIVCFMINRTKDIVDNININEEEIKRNLSGCPETQLKMNKMIGGGKERFEAYSELQGAKRKF